MTTPKPTTSKLRRLTLAPEGTVERQKARRKKIDSGLDRMLAPLEGKLVGKVRTYARIAEAYLAGKTVAQIARANHLSKRTVYRRLKRLEHQGHSGGIRPELDGRY